MCPELALGEYDNIGVAADVFCLGGILYAILTGQPPFVAPTVADTLALARECDYEPVKVGAFPADLRRGVRELERVCCKAMSREPEKRYISAFEMFTDMTLRHL